jgi:hypothetical protein
LPQPPQFWESVWVSVQVPLQQVGLPAFGPTPQTLPQAPQLLGSVVRSVQTPLQQNGWFDGHGPQPPK